jgi:cystathionine beta-lyase/cystathionine gamma-synthase
MLKAATYGVDPNLLRFSVGLEETEDLIKKFQLALSSLDAS